MRPVEVWRKAWREGIAPQLSVRALVALRRGLAEDDEHLIQGATTAPPPLVCMRDSPTEAACGIGYGGWQGEGLATVAEVEEYFAQICARTDEHFGEPQAARWFLNWFDGTPRAEVRRCLLAEVERTLASRQVGWCE